MEKFVSFGFSVLAIALLVLGIVFYPELSSYLNPVSLVLILLIIIVLILLASIPLINPKEGGPRNEHSTRKIKEAVKSDSKSESGKDYKKAGSGKKAKKSSRKKSSKKKGSKKASKKKSE